MVLIKFLFLFGGMIFLIAKKLPLFWVFLVGSLVTAIFWQYPPVNAAMVFVSLSGNIRMLKIIGIVQIILLFSAILDVTGRMDAMITSLRALLSDDRYIIAIFPSLMGLIPIMGGALLSAPMIIPSSDSLNLSPERKTFLNYWFRHIWEYIFPTYPAVILAAAILGIKIQKIFFMNLPLTALAVGLGWFFGFPRGVLASSHPSSQRTKKALSALTFAKTVFPLSVVILLAVGFGVDLLLSFFGVVTGMFVIYRIPWCQIKIILREAFKPQILLVIVGVFAFKGMLQATSASGILSRELSGMGIPLLLVFTLIPFLIGAMTGVAMAYVGITFPFLIPLVVHDHFLAYMMLAYAFGYFGVLASPVHLCLVLTKDYFKADLKEVYRIMIPPLGLLALLTFGVFGIWFLVSGP